MNLSSTRATLSGATSRFELCRKCDVYLRYSRLARKVGLTPPFFTTVPSGAMSPTSTSSVATPLLTMVSTGLEPSHDTMSRACNTRMHRPRDLATRHRATCPRPVDDGPTSDHIIFSWLSANSFSHGDSDSGRPHSTYAIVCSSLFWQKKQVISAVRVHPSPNISRRSVRNTRFLWSVAVDNTHSRPCNTLPAVLTPTRADGCRTNLQRHPQRRATPVPTALRARVND